MTTGWRDTFFEVLENIQHEGVFGIYFTVCPEEANYTQPHLVWSITAEPSGDTFEGAIRTSVGLGLDFRSPDPGGTFEMRDRAIAALRRRQVLIETDSATSLYDHETGMYRLIIGVSLDPYPPVPPVRVRRFGPQFGRAFG